MVNRVRQDFIAERAEIAETPYLFSAYFAISVTKNGTAQLLRRNKMNVNALQAGQVFAFPLNWDAYWGACRIVRIDKGEAVFLSSEKGNG